MDFRILTERSGMMELEVSWEEEEEEEDWDWRRMSSARVGGRVALMGGWD